MFPLQSKISLSNLLKISVDGWWITLTTVLPLLAKSLNKNIIVTAVFESSPVVGSSKNIIDGFVRSSTPIEVRFLSPPDIPRMSSDPIFVLEQERRPKSRINLLT